MIKAILFDLNGTVIDIYTSESDDNIYRTTANFLDYFRIRITPDELKEEFFSGVSTQKEQSQEEFPEFDAVKLFENIIRRYSRNDQLPVAPEVAAKVFRAAGRYKLQTYDRVTDTLEILRHNYKLAAVSDGQPVWALPELHFCKLAGFFSPVIISGDYGFRKPDRRMYMTALNKLQITPQEAVFVGNDMYRDIYGAGRLGMKTIFFHSNQGEKNCCGIEADYIIYRFEEIFNALNFLQDQSRRS